MRQAAAQDVQVIQFPESALPGYGPAHFESFKDYDWDQLENQTIRIQALADELSLWVVLGSMRRQGTAKPRNCLRIISGRGEPVGVYDKQRLFEKEKAYYSPGCGSFDLEIHGHQCGFLICYDNCFPELYRPYRDRNVGLLFHSFHNAGNSRVTSIKELMLANLIVRAADNGMWISSSNSSKKYSPLPACIVRPDGSMIRMKRNLSGFVVDDYPNAGLGWTYDNRSD